MRALRVAPVLAAVFLVFAATAMSGVDRSGPAVAVRGSAYGRILFDGRGFVLYAFTRDAHGRSSCTGACARAWPPYLVTRVPSAARGVDRRRLGTTRRSDGRRQATYGGRPLYYYVGDRKPLQILCQNVSEYGGLWLVVRPDGTPVR
jgi:predicted lipoprotein with Yx(FWY)xxD motif